MTAIPVSFNPSPIDDRDHYLEDVDHPGGGSTIWKQTGLRIYHTVTGPYRDHADLLANTPSLTFHRSFGFSLGTYHEVFVGALPEPLAMKLGGIDVSIGEPTPLAIEIFDHLHDKHFHGEYWDSLQTVRIGGVPIEYFEQYLLTATRRYEERFGLQPSVVEFTAASFWEDPRATDAQVIQTHPAVCLDVEPLRCFYYAACDTDPAAACIQYYRVIEFYAFMSLQQSLGAMRRDSNIGDRDFLAKASTLMSRDEKGTVVRLVRQLANSAILGDAVHSGLIQVSDPSILGSTLYDFRNALVHAKYDQRATVVVDCVVAPSTKVEAWRAVLKNLAAEAIDSLGPRHIP